MTRHPITRRTTYEHRPRRLSCVLECDRTPYRTCLGNLYPDRMKTASSTAQTDLDRLAADSLILSATLSLREAVLEDARRDYGKGKIRLPDVLHAERECDAARAALDTHRAALEQLEATEERATLERQKAALRERLETGAAALLSLETGSAHGLMAAERQVHEARHVYREETRQAQALRASLRQDFAALEALEGRPSPVTRRLTQAETIAYDDLQRVYRLAPDSVPARMDRANLHTPERLEHALEEHAARWRSTLLELSSDR